MLNSLFNSLVILISLSTTTGVLVHDTRIDRAAATALALPSVMASIDTTDKLASLQDGGHVHTERNSVSQVINDFGTQNPRIQPRANEDRRHLMPKYVLKGHHAFDNYNLPIV